MMEQDDDMYCYDSPLHEEIERLQEELEKEKEYHRISHEAWEEEMDKVAKLREALEKIKMQGVLGNFDDKRPAHKIADEALREE